MITIAIVEDNKEFRKALESIIQTQDDFVLKGSFENAEDALKGIPENPVDIVICDISLPGMSGVELVAALKDRLPQTQFMVCSIHDDDETIFEALKQGASSYLLKQPVTVDEIVRAIRDLYKGGSVMSPYIARRVIQSMQKPASQEHSQLLSQREREVLELLSKGFSYKEIGSQLGIGTETVKTHMRNTYQKLQVQNKIEALNKMRLI
jgi:DNA-binding NarL/FixJ family response regulator